jgi:hypothetical protein
MGHIANSLEASWHLDPSGQEFLQDLLVVEVVVSQSQKPITLGDLWLVFEPQVKLIPFNSRVEH